MRIGILTLHNGVNYGGTLQCIALYKVIESFGHSVEVIDFKPTQVASFVKRLIYNISCCRNLSDIQEILSRLIGKNEVDKPIINENLVNKFNSFRNKFLNFSPCVDEDSISSLNERYDCIIVGSDQIWSSFVRNRLTYWGEWTPAFQGKLIAYAACATSDKYPIVRKHEMKRLLNRFEAISVRDIVSQTLVSKLIRKRVPIVLDPTFLYDFDCFNRQPLIKEPYIFVYVLGKEINGGNQKALDIIKQQIGEECKIIATTVYDRDIPYADVTLKDVLPNQWVNLIIHAKFVFTDSFHGSIFALKDNVPFLAYCVEKNRVSRLLDLQNSLCREKIVVTSTDEILKCFHLNSVINKKINKIIIQSLSVIKIALQ